MIRKLVVWNLVVSVLKSGSCCPLACNTNILSMLVLYVNVFFFSLTCILFYLLWEIYLVLYDAYMYYGCLPGAVLMLVLWCYYVDWLKIKGHFMSIAILHWLGYWSMHPSCKSTLHSHWRSKVNEWHILSYLLIPICFPEGEVISRTN
jgi:hypothetical protein